MIKPESVVNTSGVLAATNPPPANAGKPNRGISPIMMKR
jgi:hypothetical protein